MADELNRSDLRRLEDLHAGNVAQEAELARQGAALDRTSILALQVQALQDVIVGDDEAVKLDYELAYQQRLAGALEHIAAELARAKLLKPPSNIQQLLRPNGHG